MTTMTPHRVADLLDAARAWEHQHRDHIAVAADGEGRIWHGIATMPHPAAPDLILRLRTTTTATNPADARELACELVHATVDAHFARPNDSAEHALGLRRTARWDGEPPARQHVAALLANDGARVALPGEMLAAALHVRMAYGIPEDELLIEHVVTGVRELRAQLAGMNTAQGPLA